MKIRLLRKPAPKASPWVALLEKHGYPPAAIATAAPKLEGMSQPWQEAVLTWDRQGRLPKWQVEGFTAEGLVEHLGMHPIGAFLALEWLQREPTAAKLALAQPMSRLVVNEKTLDMLEESEAADKPIDDTKQE